MTGKNSHSEYLAVYKKLNNAQKKAVGAIDGPLLVIAGPGTGKTQLLSMRVANILDKTDTDPSDILCLTFTNFAATNMRERLAQLIGPVAVHVTVRTFHSFAADIMNTYPDYFWHGARLTVVPDSIQLEIIENIVNKLPLDNPLAQRFSGAYTMLKDIKEALKLVKEAGLTPDKLTALMTINLAYIDQIESLLVDILSPPLSYKRLPAIGKAISSLPDQDVDSTIAPLKSLSSVLKLSFSEAIEKDSDSNKTTLTGKCKQRWLQTVDGKKGMWHERRRTLWWQALADVYSTYRKQLHARGYYDYADMLVEVIAQLEQHPDLLSDIQEHCHYVLIDEFQDTNAAQLRLAHLLVTNSASINKPNIMAVGDDDQTIFAFNGAELSNMVRFQTMYRNVKTIILTKNYRSNQAILDFAGSIIAQAGNRLVGRSPHFSKQLRAAAKRSRGQLKHVRFLTREQQFFEISTHIQASWQGNPGADLGVLARSHDSLKELSMYLRKLGVPVRYEKHNNVLSLPLIEQLNLASSVIVGINEGNLSEVNANLARLISHPAWGVPPLVLWQLATKLTPRDDWLSHMTNHKDQHLQKVGKWLLWLSSEANYQPAAVLIEYLLGLRTTDKKYTSPLKSYFLEKSVNQDYLEELSGLRLIKQLVREFVDSRLPMPRLSDYVRFIRLNMQHGQTITDQSWYVSGTRAVQLMTVHAAKGLEFDTVFLVDAVDSDWKPRGIRRHSPANLPLQPYGEQLDDYIRLAYVAATRAKHSFIASSYRYDEAGKDILATPFLSALPIEERTSFDADQAIKAVETSLSWPRLNDTKEAALLKSRLEEYQLNATALLQFLDIRTGGPSQFFERQLLRLPQVTTPAMAYGTAIHKALQVAQLDVNRGSYSLSHVLKQYEQTLLKQQLPIQETERYLIYGQKVLRNLLANTPRLFSPGNRAEVTINGVQVGPARLTGTLDHLEIANNDLIITDYKTGKPLTSFKSNDRSGALKAWRHSSQLLFYSLLVKSSPHFLSYTVHAQMLYVEADTKNGLKLTLEPDATSLKRMEQLVIAVWRHITELNFPDTSHYSADRKGIETFEEDLLSGKI
jgi:DNA helicase-2/ATP-dependent DNA helicase PcrA